MQGPRLWVVNRILNLKLCIKTVLTIFFSILQYFLRNVDSTLNFFIFFYSNPNFQKQIMGYLRPLSNQRVLGHAKSNEAMEVFSKTVSEGNAKCHYYFRQT